MKQNNDQNNFKLAVESLYHRCDLSQLSFKTTADIKDDCEHLGQECAMGALKFGIRIPAADGLSKVLPIHASEYLWGSSVSKSAIRAVLFDYGGVIAEEGFYNGLVDLAEKQSLDARSMPEEGMKAVYDSGFVLGHGTAADFWALLRKRTGLEGDDDFLTDRIFVGFQIRHWVIELVRRLRSKAYVVGILSDQTHWLNELDSRDHFFSEFDHIYNSYYLGKGKRDLSLFTDVVDNLNLQPAEVLFIDDSEKNVQTARKMGLRAILYVDHERFVSELEDILKEEIEH